MKVFWDTNLFIYLIERHAQFQPRVLAHYHELRERNAKLVTSTLTLGELTAQPMRRGRADLVERYTALLSDGAVELVAFDVPAAQHYAEIRAKTTLRQPDALQLACAAAAGASEFVTNDRQLWNVEVSGIERIRGV